MAFTRVIPKFLQGYAAAGLMDKPKWQSEEDVDNLDAEARAEHDKVSWGGMPGLETGVGRNWECGWVGGWVGGGGGSFMLPGLSPAGFVSVVRVCLCPQGSRVIRMTACAHTPTPTCKCVPWPRPSL
jgi:hypothetical protein